MGEAGGDAKVDGREGVQVSLAVAAGAAGSKRVVAAGVDLEETRIRLFC